MTNAQLDYTRFCALGEQNPHALANITGELLEALLIAQSQLQGLRDSIYDEGKRKIRAIIAKATQA